MAAAISVLQLEKPGLIDGNPDQLAAHLAIDGLHGHDVHGVDPWGQGREQDQREEQGNGGSDRGTFGNAGRFQGGLHF